MAFVNYGIKSIVLFGDSITEWSWNAGGLAQRLASVYARKLDALNRGLRGYNTERALPVFNAQIAGAAKKPRVLVIWFGANDAALPGFVHHVPLERFTAILSLFVRVPDTKVLLITPPPVEETAVARFFASIGHTMDRTLANTRLYADAVCELGAAHGVPVVDAFGALWNAAGGESEGLVRFLPDGLHPNAEGYEIVFDLVMAAIETHWPELAPGRLSDVVPEWDEQLKRAAA